MLSTARNSEAVIGFSASLFACVPPSTMVVVAATKYGKIASPNQYPVCYKGFGVNFLKILF